MIKETVGIDFQLGRRRYETKHTYDFYGMRKWMVLELQVVASQTRNMCFEETPAKSNGIVMKLAFDLFRVIIEELRRIVNKIVLREGARHDER